jgi:hypothetical protein
MKKIIILEEETNSNYTNIVSEFLSIQFNYGLYDFNAEKIFNDLERLYNVKLLETRLPYYKLVDPEMGVINCMFKEEYD